jgi:ComF family protein
VSLGEVISLIAPPLCFGCGAPARGGHPLCRRCRGALRWLGEERGRAGSVEVWAPLAYEGPARALVRALKYGGAAGVVETMAAQVVACAPPGLLGDGALVPVPLHAGRRRRRGFNQAERLAAAIERRTGRPRVHCLMRRGPPTAQVGRGRGDRLSLVTGTVGVRRGVPPPRRAVLVDDVVTTGATLRACAEALRAAGTEQVTAVAYARTPGR